MTSFKENLAQWRNRSLTTATWAQFEKDVYTSLSAYLTSIFPFGALGLVCTDDEWAALPNVTVNGALVHPKPILPDIPAQPAPSNGGAADDRRYDQERREAARLTLLRNEIEEVWRSMKQFLLDPDVGGDAHSTAVGDGALIDQINEGPEGPYGRLKAYLGTPNYSTFQLWRSLYSTPAGSMPVTEWMRQDTYANNLLAAHQQELSANQRLDAFRQCYSKSVPVMKCWDRYCVANPLVAGRNLAGALAYIRAQEPIILEEMKATDLGFGALAVADLSAQDAALEEPSLSMAAAAGQMYTQIQLDRAIAEALSRHTPERERRQPREPKYCWLHGYQWSHTGDQCKSIEAGAKVRVFRDTRPQLRDNTIVFSHQGCRHSPKCITVQDAQEATGPTSLTHAAGNAMRPTER